MRTKIKRNTPEEEAAIQRGIDADPDNPEWTAEDFARARGAPEVMPPAVYNALVERRRRGPQKAPTKEMIAVRLDRDLVERLRATGPGWQGRINETLRRAVMGAK
jgi:uncharacterized protein (DUF4415 family)